MKIPPQRWLSAGTAPLDGTVFLIKHKEGIMTSKADENYFIEITQCSGDADPMLLDGDILGWYPLPEFMQ